MNYLLGLLLFLSTNVQAQQIALLDRSFKIPATYTESITLETFSNGVFPVYLSDVVPVIEAVEAIGKKINQSRYDREGVYHVRIGHSAIILKTEISRQVQKYNMVLSTEANGFTTYIDLVKGNYNREAQLKVHHFLEYLRNSVPPSLDAVSLVR